MKNECFPSIILIIIIINMLLLTVENVKNTKCIANILSNKTNRLRMIYTFNLKMFFSNMYNCKYRNLFMLKVDHCLING